MESAPLLEGANTEGSYFAEAEEVVGTIEALTADPPLPAPTGRSLHWVTDVLERYQEQPSLLDPHLEALVGPLMGAVRGRTAEGPSEKMSELMRVVYVLCKVRGYKTIVRFFPHAVADLEPALALLRASCEPSTPVERWHVSYGVLLWLSVLMLLPFDLNLIDSTLGAPTASPAAPGAPPPQQGLIASVVELARAQLGSAGPSRDAAAVLLARLLTRPRMQAHLSAFVGWAVGVLDAADRADAAAAAKAAAAAAAAEQPAAAAAAEPAAPPPPAPPALSAAESHAAHAALVRARFELIGVYSALASCLKVGNRSELRAWLPLLRAQLGAPAAPSSSTLARKLRIKLAQRLGLLLLPPRVAGWRYDRGARSLLANLQMASAADAAAGVRVCGICATSDAAPAKLGGAVGDGLGASASTDAAAATAAATAAGAAADDDEEVEIAEEIEDVISQLLGALQDDDTIVRWSAAKGLGRLLARLPFELGDQVIGSALECFEGQDEHCAWHGGCLTLAELARRGLLLPARLADAVPLVCRALSYDVMRGAHSVGQHVRDAAAYACWAFARAYTPAVMAPHVHELATALLVTACFDREVNCRRAAAAAFQEHVGRQGSFAHGIAIITVADYFGVGSRVGAFSRVGGFVAGYARYTRPLLEHLWAVKAQHWDEGVRALAAKAAGALCGAERPYAAAVMLPALCARALSNDLRVRHGAALMAAELVLALATDEPADGAAELDSEALAAALGPRALAPPDPSASSADLPPARAPPTRRVLAASLVALVQNLVPAIEQARLYRGRGGEVMRVAACRVLECCALAGLPSSGRAQAKLIESTVTECLRHPNEAISGAAARALRAISAGYLDSDVAARNAKLGLKFAKTLRSDPNAAATRGAALALAALPRAQLLAAAEEVVAALVHAATLPESVEARDPETRRNAAASIADVVRTLRIAPPAEAAAAAPPAAAAAPTVAAAAAPTVAAAAAAPAAEPAEAPPNGGRDGLSEAQLGRLWAQLLACIGDYEVDKRGDVGSWVREAAMLSLEQLAYLAAAAQQSRPTGGAPAVWTAQMATDLCRALLQQAHEKIDRTRALAAGVLGRLLTRAEPAVEGMACRAELLAMFGRFGALAPAALACAAEVATDADADDAAATAAAAAAEAAREAAHAAASAWSDGALSLPPYADAALLGFCISIGGLTESTQRAAGGTIVGYLAALPPAGLASFLARLHALLAAHTGNAAAEPLPLPADERVLLPGLRAVEYIAASGALHPLREPAAAGASACRGAEADARARAPSDALALLVREQARGVREPRRLLASAGAMVALLPYCSVGVRRSLLRSALVLLAHKYPRVRAATASALYEHALTCEADLPEGRAEDASALLVGTAWDGDDADVKAARATLLEMYGFDAVITTAAAPRAPKLESDPTFGTYSDLVQTSGY